MIIKLIKNTLLCSFLFILNTSFYRPPILKQQTKIINGSQGNEIDLTSLPQNYFQSPLDLPLSIVGNFGEPRRAHFHTGLDFRTNQEEGHVVFAAAEGYISRINVSGAGYGNALYITHPNGFVTVYGHLLKFDKRIEKRLRAEQYAKESFAVDFNLTPYEIPVKKGDTIALSGNSGGSGGPHLHFEIRDSLERVYNPMLFDYKLKDNIRPTVAYLKIYPMDELKNKCNGYRLKLNGSNGQYEVAEGLIKVNASQVSLSVNTYDGINLSTSHIGIYNITAFDGNQMIYECQMDRISFNEKRCVQSHIDYPIFMNEGRKCFHKVFCDPGNRCPIYSNLYNRGIINLSDEKVHRIHIEVSDFRGNVSTIKLQLQYDKKSQLLKEVPFHYTTKFDYDHDNEFSNSDISVKIPKGCLFDDVYFNYSTTPATDAAIFSKLHKLDEPTTQALDWFTVSLKAENLPAELEQKALVVYKGSDGVASSRGGTFANGFITAQTREFGTYYIRADTTAPKIAAQNVIPGRNMRTYKKLLFKITDNLSGVADFDTYLDGHWIVTEYDAKTATLFHILSQDIEPGEHTFTVEVTDNRNNKAQYSVKFLY